MKKYFTKIKTNGVSWCIPNEILAQSDISREYILEKLQTIDCLDYKDIAKRYKNNKNSKANSDLGEEENFQLIKHGRRKYVGFTNVINKSGKIDAIVKVFNCSSFLLKLKHLFVPSKAKREFIISHVLKERNVPGILAIAVGEKRCLGVLTRSYLVVKKVENSSNLKEFFYDELHTPKERHDLIERFAKTARISHDNGILQTDFALNNFLVEKCVNNEFKVYLIDYERTEIHKKIPDEKRFWTIAKLNRANEAFTTIDKLRFLKAYINLDLYRPLTKEITDDFKQLTVNLNMETISLLREGAQIMWKGCVKANRKFLGFADKTYNGFFLKKYEIKALLKEIANFENLKKIEEANFKGLSIKIVSAELYGDRNWNYHRILKVDNADKNQSLYFWHTANALSKGKLNVFLPVGLFMSKNESYFITSYYEDLQDVKHVFKSADTSKKREKILHKLAKFLYYFHYFGSFASEVADGDLLAKLKDDKMDIYLSHFYNCVFNMSLTRQEGEADIDKIVDYLGETICDEEVELLKKIYLKNE